MMRYNIIIPTHNRQDYLKRILGYYDKFEKKIKIIIADSSQEDIKKLNRDIISSLSNIEIRHLDYYSPKLNPYHKFADVINYADEKYCIFCADDDFITPCGINMAIEFLERNPDFTCAHGNYIAFCLKDNEKGQKQFYWWQIYPYKSVTSLDPKERLLFHFSNYHPTFYAVHRTSFLKMILKENLKFTDDYRFGELLPSMLASIYGKIKRLDVFYDAREAHPDSSRGTSKKIIDFIGEGTYDEKYSRFKDCLAFHLSKNSQLNIEGSKKVVDEGMKSYMDLAREGRPPEMKQILINGIKDFLDYLKLPDDIDESIRRPYRKIFRPIGDPSSKYYDDLSKIRGHVSLYSVK